MRLLSGGTGLAFTNLMARISREIVFLKDTRRSERENFFNFANNNSWSFSFKDLIRRLFAVKFDLN